MPATSAKPERAELPPVRPDIAAFAATLRPSDPLYWPALAASDGCEASLAELNALLIADDCRPFAQRELDEAA